MSHYIPFVTSDASIGLVHKFYDNAKIVRVSLDRMAELVGRIDSTKVWLDPAVDGMGEMSRHAKSQDDGNGSKWLSFMQGTPRFEDIADESFWKAPDKQIVWEFVKSILNQCQGYSPKWITVPQLPLVDGADRNKINRELARASGKWKDTSKYSGHMILPLVFTNQRQLNRKRERNQKISVAEKCFEFSYASGVWVVDKSLKDESGSSTLREKRFPGIISFHEELNERITAKYRIAGPYWGLNLVLWARDLVSHGAIGVGGSYQYFLAGGQAQTPGARIALGPLRRRAVVDTSLKQWLEKSISILPSSHPASKEFEALLKKFSAWNDRPTARQHVARFYRVWWDKFAATPPAGRSLALFQDLSGAYALGKLLPEIKATGTDRQPESVVEPLMLSSL